MIIGSDEWLHIVRQGADRMGLHVTAFQALQFGRHAQSLLQWNRKINLTAINDPIQVAVKHYLDAIAPLNHIPADGRLLDIGTGGGFPGIPLKILRPVQRMTLIDSVRKKISFVKSAIRQLGLKQIEALHIRAQDLRLQRAHASAYDIIICRALADLKEVLPMALPLLAEDGRIVVYQGPQGAGGAADGVLQLKHDERLYRLQVCNSSYQLPFTGDKRSIAVLSITQH